MTRSPARRVALTSGLALLIGAGMPYQQAAAHSVSWKPWRPSTQPQLFGDGSDSGFELVPAPAGSLPQATPETPGAGGFELTPATPDAAAATAEAAPLQPSARAARMAVPAPDGAASADRSVFGSPTAIPAARAPVSDYNGFDLLPASDGAVAVSGSAPMSVIGTMLPAAVRLTPFASAPGLAAPAAPRFALRSNTPAPIVEKTLEAPDDNGFVLAPAEPSAALTATAGPTPQAMVVETRQARLALLPDPQPSADLAGPQRPVARLTAKTPRLKVRSVEPVRVAEVPVRPSAIAAAASVPALTATAEQARRVDVVHARMAVRPTDPVVKLASRTDKVAAVQTTSAPQFDVEPTPETPGAGGFELLAATTSFGASEAAALAPAAPIEVASRAAPAEMVLAQAQSASDSNGFESSSQSSGQGGAAPSSSNDASGFELTPATSAPAAPAAPAGSDFETTGDAQAQPVAQAAPAGDFQSEPAQQPAAAVAASADPFNAPLAAAQPAAAPEPAPQAVAAAAPQPEPVAAPPAPEPPVVLAQADPAPQPQAAAATA